MIRTLLYTINVLKLNSTLYSILSLHIFFSVFHKILGGIANNIDMALHCLDGRLAPVSSD